MTEASTTLARLSCDEATARRLADALGDSLDPEDCACAAFEAGDGQWRLEIYFRNAPDEAAVRALVATAAGEAAAAKLEFASRGGGRLGGAKPRRPHPRRRRPLHRARRP